MKVFVLEIGEYDQRGIDGVFDSLEAAQGVCVGPWTEGSDGGWWDCECHHPDCHVSIVAYDLQSEPAQRQSLPELRPPTPHWSITIVNDSGERRYLSGIFGGNA